MTNPNKTAIAIVVDRSGSMGTIASDAEGSINAFIDEQRKVEGECTVRLTEFDDRVEVVYPSTDINDVRTYRLVPRGTTALQDAMGQTIVSLGEELAALSEDDRPGTVIFVTVTDGYENASREYTPAQVKELVQKQENEFNWKFVFLAANQDATLTGQQYGFTTDNSISYAASAKGVANVTTSLSSYATTTRSGSVAVFDSADREAALES